MRQKRHLSLPAMSRCYNDTRNAREVVADLMDAEAPRGRDLAHRLRLAEADLHDHQRVPGDGEDALDDFRAARAGCEGHARLVIAHFGLQAGNVAAGEVR